MMYLRHVYWRNQRNSKALGGFFPLSDIFLWILGIDLRILIIFVFTYHTNDSVIQRYKVYDEFSKESSRSPCWSDCRFAITWRVPWWWLKEVTKKHGVGYINGKDFGTIDSLMKKPRLCSSVRIIFWISRRQCEKSLYTYQIPIRIYMSKCIYLRWRRQHAASSRVCRNVGFACKTRSKRDGWTP